MTKPATITIMTDETKLTPPENEIEPETVEPLDLDDVPDAPDIEVEALTVEPAADPADEPLDESFYSGDWSAYTPDLGEMDIDSALAAVASLSETVAEREADEQARIDAREKAIPTYIPESALPPMTTLKRGHLGSVVPALLLIAIGAWLTLMTTSGAAVDPLLLAAVAFGAVALSLFAQWLGSGRWSRGTLFFGVLIALVMLFFAAGMQPNGLDLTESYPLLLAVFGAALIAAGLLARPVKGRALIPGVLLLAAGGIGLAINLGIIPAELLSFAVPVAPFVLIAVVVLLLLPRLRRGE